jgi:hypothetical protein
MIEDLSEVAGDRVGVAEFLDGLDFARPACRSRRSSSALSSAACSPWMGVSLMTISPPCRSRPSHTTP